MKMMMEQHQVQLIAREDLKYNNNMGGIFYDETGSTVDMEEFKSHLSRESLELFELGIIGTSLSFTPKAQDIADELNLRDRMEEVKEIRREQIRKEEANKK